MYYFYAIKNIGHHARFKKRAFISLSSLAWAKFQSLCTWLSCCERLEEARTTVIICLSNFLFLTYFTFKFYFTIFYPLLRFCGCINRVGSSLTTGLHWVTSWQICTSKQLFYNKHLEWRYNSRKKKESGISVRNTVQHLLNGHPRGNE